MEEEKEEDWFNDPAQEPEVKKFTLVDLVRVIAILFAFVVYFFIFLKIMFLS